MAIVLDASAGLSLLVASQATAASEAFRASAASEELLAPSVFRFEMRHALIKLERRALVSPAALDVDLPALESVVTVTPAPSDLELAGISALARAEGLGLYDAAYLILAIARAGTLASRDVALLDAAKSQIANRHPDTRTICC